MFSEEMLMEAAAELNAAMLKTVDQIGPDDFIPSAKFKRKMKRLISRTDHPIRHFMVYRVASILLALLIGFMTVLTLSPSVRAKFLGWVQTKFDYYTKYSYYGERTYKLDQFVCVVSYLPQGYVQAQEYSTADRCILDYVNETSGELMHLWYTKEPQTIEHFLYDTQYEKEIVYLNDVQIDLYTSRNSNHGKVACWVDAEYDLFLYLSADDSTEEILKIIKNIKIISK